MNQEWFEMPEIRRRTFERSVWIPLRAINKIEETGQYGYSGYKDEFFGVGTLAVPIDKKTEVQKLQWDDVGIGNNHSGYIENNEYTPTNIYKDDDDEFVGEHLVLEQRGNSEEHHVWHLNQDLVITLGLKREGNVWVRPDEGYIEVAKLYIRDDGSHYFLEIRAAHLRDYLCARSMALYMTSYRDRVEVVEDASHILWEENPITEDVGMDRWEGRINEIHEGGMSFGEKIAVFHVSRTDVDPDEDVPSFDFPTDDNVKSESWTKEDHGRKLYRIEGELWRNEWIEPASSSPIIRGDKMTPTVFFITDAEGKQENRETLVNGSRWLWFRPDVVMALSHHRGGSLRWYTRFTGSVRCSPDYKVHFGINVLGLVNVYAKDIGMLPDWQQKIWAGYNVSPEGKVSEELLASQMRAQPASTQAPEPFLKDGLSLLNNVAQNELGISLLRDHDYISRLLENSHRFRAIDEAGLYALAKDVARLTADSIDTDAIQQLVSPPKDTKWGSLKSLEKLLTLRISPATARAMVGPLVGVYELRLGDAHLPSSDIDEALALVKIDKTEPYVHQGLQLLGECVSSIYDIVNVLKHWNTST